MNEEDLSAIDVAKDEKGKEVVYLIYGETFFQSLCSDVLTFGLLLFSIWFSSGSKFWTFVCALMILSFALCKRKKVGRFSSKDAMKKYVAEL